VAYGGFVASTGHPSVDELLSRGGLTSMLETIALIICALAFGGVMERAGFLATLAAAILKFAHGTGRLVTATLLTCFGMNLLASDQYLSIVMPGRMYREAFNKEGLQPKVLSRTLEDGGTLSSPLIPWNSCGAFMGTTLAVPALSYAPYAFVNLLCPILAILFACTGWKIARQNPGPPAR
jgi:Na+:H+ antiporter, NhaC family